MPKHNKPAARMVGGRRVGAPKKAKKSQDFIKNATVKKELNSIIPQEIPDISMINMYKEDGTVIQVNRPKLKMAGIKGNTYLIEGGSSSNKPFKDVLSEETMSDICFSHVAKLPAYQSVIEEFIATKRAYQEAHAKEMARQSGIPQISGNFDDVADGSEIPQVIGNFEDVDDVE